MWNPRAGANLLFGEMGFAPTVLPMRGVGLCFLVGGSAHLGLHCAGATSSVSANLRLCALTPWGPHRPLRMVSPTAHAALPHQGCAGTSADSLERFGSSQTTATQCHSRRPSHRVSGDPRRRVSEPLPQDLTAMREAPSWDLGWDTCLSGFRTRVLLECLRLRGRGNISTRRGLFMPPQL